jgi:Lon protease-like protein
LPAMPLPLRVFEERYKEMMADILPSHSEFGVVFAKDDGIVNIGCTAVVDRILNRYDDGRLDLVAVGQRRFLINALDQEKSYLRADVEYFNDEDASEVPADLREKARDAYRLLLKLGDSDGVSDDLKFELSRMSFQLARFIDDFDKRQTVLSLRSEVERLEYLVRVVPEYVIQHQRTALAKRVGPLNGHAKASI